MDEFPWGYWMLEGRTTLVTLLTTNCNDESIRMLVAVNRRSAAFHFSDFQPYLISVEKETKVLFYGISKYGWIKYCDVEISVHGQFKKLNADLGFSKGGLQVYTVLARMKRQNGNAVRRRCAVSDKTELTSARCKKSFEDAWSRDGLHKLCMKLIQYRNLL